MSNPFYMATGTPGQGSPGQSAALRAEFAAIAAGFEALSAVLSDEESGSFLTTSLAAATYLALAGGTLTGALGVGVAPGTAMMNVYRTGSGQSFLSEPVLRLGVSHALAEASIQFYANGVSQGAGIGARSGSLYLGTGGAIRMAMTPDGNVAFGAAVTAAQLIGPLSGNVTGNVTGNVSGSSGSCTGAAATAGYAATAGTASVAASATTASSVPWIGVSGRPTDLASFTNGPGYVTTAQIVGTNGYGTRTVSGAGPSGGSDGDLWYVV